METHRTYRHGCSPTEAQKRQLAQTFGCARYVSSWALEMRTDAYHEEGESVGYDET
jgi:putative transposase